MAHIDAYLMFDGRCEEAFEFYRAKLGAEATMKLRFSENPDLKPGMLAPGTENKIMHTQWRIGDTTILASDGHCGGKPNFDGFALSLTVANEAEADKAFNALADGGVVQMPLAKTFFSPRFGMVNDRFGVHWIVYVK